MATVVGTFQIEDGFFITGRGLMLAGVLSGQVKTGCHLAFPNGIRCRVKAVEAINTNGRFDVIGLFVDAPVSSREELLRHAVIGATAEIFTS